MTVTITFMIATLLALVAGIIFMAIGGKLDKKYANKLMSLRVLLQAISIACLGLMYILYHH